MHYTIMKIYFIFYIQLRTLAFTCHAKLKNWYYLLSLQPLYLLEMYAGLLSSYACRIVADLHFFFILFEEALPKCVPFEKYHSSHYWIFMTLHIYLSPTIPHIFWTRNRQRRACLWHEIFDKMNEFLHWNIVLCQKQ